MSPFKEKVIAIVRSIPSGKVVSYGQVGLYAGLPRAARQVGWILNGMEEQKEFPWWRVVNNKGHLSIRGTQHNDKELQRKLLQAEGVVVSGDFTLPMETYRYAASAEELKRLQLPVDYIEFVISKYNI